MSFLPIVQKYIIKSVRQMFTELIPLRDCRIGIVSQKWLNNHPTAGSSGSEQEHSRFKSPRLRREKTRWAMPTTNGTQSAPPNVEVVRKCVHAEIVLNVCFVGLKKLVRRKKSELLYCNMKWRKKAGPCRADRCVHAWRYAARDCIICNARTAGNGTDARRSFA